MKPLFQTRIAATLTLAFALIIALPALAQSAADMAALESRLMARLEQRMAEEGEASRADQEAQRLAFEQAIRATARSSNALDRRALVAIDAGRTGQGIGVLEERARARDAAATADAASRRERADEWKRIGALAFLDSTDRAVAAYEAALQFAPDDPEILDQLAYLYQRQARNTDRTRIAQRLADHSEAEWRAKGLIHLGDVQMEMNENTGARRYFEQAIEVASQGGATRQRVRAMNRLAATQIRNNRQFETTIEQALTMARAEGFRYEEAEALYMRGTALFARGRGSFTGRTRSFEQAEVYFAQVYAIAVEVGDEIGAAQVQVRRGHVARVMENYPLAERMLREGIATFERRGVVQRLGFARHQLAAVLAEQGRLDEARPLFRSSVDAARATNLPLYEGAALMDWAKAEYEAGARDEACRLIRQSNAAFGRAEGAGAFRLQTGIMSSTYCG